MRLILTVFTYKGLPISDAIPVEFTELGGSIGRKPGNAMVLPDSEQIVSGRHAEIFFENNGFAIRDISTNGTVLAKSGFELKHDCAALKDGEILRLGEYELGVRILDSALVENQPIPDPIPFDAPVFSAPLTPAFSREPEANSFSIQGMPDAQPFFHDLDSFAQQDSAPLDQPIFKQQPPSSPFQDSFVLPNVSEAGYVENDIAQFLKGLDALDSPSPSVSLSPGIGAPLGDVAQSPFEFPANQQANALFEAPVHNALADFANEPGKPVSVSPLDSASPVRPVNPMVPPQSPSSPTQDAHQPDEMMRLFLLGAGIGDPNFLQQQALPEAMQSIGSLFRSLVEGLMEVLRARAEMKSEFRVSVTTLRSFDNNPLKFNPDVESVLKLLISPKNPAFTDPEIAVKQAFKDIQSHQLAMTAGIQASLAAILDRFNPQAIEQQLGEGLIFQKKSRCWEVYAERYPELKNLATDGFFGDEFAEAYEKQMLLLSKRQT